MLQKDANLNTILEEWPQYKQSFGHLMIELDFKKLYPEKQNLLFDKWESFCQAIPPLLEIYIKDSNSLTTWRQFKEGSINAEHANRQKKNTSSSTLLQIQEIVSYCGHRQVVNFSQN
ncbi:uncharacterized protein LOC129246057 [Anastrepha obliqua]|uniref:uncharacterized protein LOC129246057 n=1 Tax=Anastrepha obliqua TaxID=95512 RepID=UPI00240968C6|nr:uncharacterized protein LOC129246057 [Anastrepha obliqua]